MHFQRTGIAENQLSKFSPMKLQKVQKTKPEQKKNNKDKITINETKSNMQLIKYTKS